MSVTRQTTSRPLGGLRTGTRRVGVAVEDRQEGRGGEGMSGTSRPNRRGPGNESKLTGTVDTY